MLMAKRFEQFKDGGLERGGTLTKDAQRYTTHNNPGRCR